MVTTTETITSSIPYILSFIALGLIIAFAYFSFAMWKDSNSIVDCITNHNPECFTNLSTDIATGITASLIIQSLWLILIGIWILIIGKTAIQNHFIGNQ